METKIGNYLELLKTGVVQLALGIKVSKFWGSQCLSLRSDVESWVPKHYELLELLPVGITKTNAMAGNVQLKHARFYG